MFTRLNLTQRFSLWSFFLIFGALFAVGAWTGEQIQNGVMRRTADLTALYVDSLLSHHLQDALQPGTTSAGHAEEVSALLGDSPLGRSLAAYKIWSADGRVLYSNEPELVGLQFPVEGGLAEALQGNVTARLSDLSQPQDAHERERWSELIETYAPLTGSNPGEIVGVIEFYQTVDALNARIRVAQTRLWIVLGICAAVIYLLLLRLIHGANRTINTQQRELQQTVTQLSGLLEQNQQLHNRVSRAAARTTALNERFLSRISADLHDGPGQDLALALLRIDELAEICESCRVALRKRGAAGKDFQLIRTALQSALADLRLTLAGLRLPEIDSLSPAETAERAVRDFEHKTGATVSYAHGDIPDQAPLSVKITLYRVLQEALSNGYRHADGADQQVKIDFRDGQLLAEVADSGDGFDAGAVGPEHLGLAGMRERVEILGGLFEMHSEPGRGTRVRAALPLGAPDVDGD